MGPGFRRESGSRSRQLPAQPQSKIHTFSDVGGGFRRALNPPYETAGSSRCFRHPLANRHRSCDHVGDANPQRAFFHAQLASAFALKGEAEHAEA
jgi:hypothetical protein